MTSRWPAVVDYLLTLLPTLPGWERVAVYDTDPVTADAPASYAVVGGTADDNVSGTFVRATNINGFMVDETGAVRVHVVTRTGDADPAGVRVDGFALLDALEDALTADQRMGGVLGQVGTVNLAAAVQPAANQLGVAQSLVVSISYTALI